MSGPGVPALPPAVEALLAALDRTGHAAHVVGASALALLVGARVREFEVATSSDARVLLASHATAIPLDAARSRLLLPSPDGPIELLPYAADAGLDAALKRHVFRPHAIAIDRSGSVHDPFGGREDLRAGRLRCVGPASELLTADPRQALCAVRIVAETELEPAPELIAALPGAIAGVSALPAAVLRAELHRVLLGARARRALELLHDSGLEDALAPGAAADGPRVVEALPLDLELRLAGWLRGSRFVRTLRRLREPQERVVAVERLLQLHPIDRMVRPSQETRLRRIARRSDALAGRLLALRAAELSAGDQGADGEAKRALERLRAAFERAGAAPPSAPGPDLALDGHAVIRILDCRPGPEVGRALHHLRKAVEADPSCNTPDGLRERLLAWRSGSPDQEPESTTQSLPDDFA